MTIQKSIAKYGKINYGVRRAAWTKNKLRKNYNCKIGLAKIGTHELEAV